MNVQRIGEIALSLSRLRIERQSELQRRVPGPAAQEREIQKKLLQLTTEADS